MSSYLIIFIIITLLIVSLLKRINCYELFIEGTKEGLKTTINMFPFLFTFMFAITCLQSSGILEFIEYFFSCEVYCKVINTSHLFIRDETYSIINIY